MYIYTVKKGSVELQLKLRNVGITQYHITMQAFYFKLFINIYYPVQLFSQKPEYCLLYKIE